MAKKPYQKFNKKNDFKARAKDSRHKEAELDTDEELSDAESDEMVYGRNPVIETLRSKRDVNKLFVQDGLSGDKINSVLKEAKKRKVQLSFVPKTKLDNLSDGGNHQGVVLAASPVNYASIGDLFTKAEEKGEQPFFLLLDGIEDPHNLGSIIRTADASGAHGVIIPKRRAVGLTSTVAKSSAGAIEHVLVARVTNMASTIDELKDRGLWIFGTDMKGKDYRHWDVSSPVGLVIGSEGKGMSRLVKDKVDETLSIPMVGDTQSLNASVASGLLMYEVYRKRHSL
ncbi:23S rRNA (guanosine2251-2'-O)-methyltransferase [Alkalibacterium olivapovliticus]|uniref:23S rRNA (Guanosine2251-2'-O)-methyltransferase n=2 Tax=Alkalibacterium olivapovliticus TaxID=99907 RepID=A0A2T0W6M3_9LACT|nr:23S rRNA (guanosine2251-2'-O)-methyltransferase [Alkalibacterium olivapovliticus]